MLVSMLMMFCVCSNACLMPPAAKFIGVSSGLILSVSPFIAYMLPAVMIYDFCQKCLLGVVLVSC